MTHEPRLSEVIASGTAPSGESAMSAEFETPVKLSVVVPCFNEEDTVGTCVARILEV